MQVCWRTIVVVNAILIGIVACMLSDGRSAFAADIAYGEYLSSECATCHRRDGQDQGIPSIIGLPSDKIVGALKAYKSKERSNPIMQTIAGRLSDSDMAALAAFYSGLKTPQ